MAELEGLSKSLSFDPNIPIEEQMINTHRRVDEDQYIQDACGALEVWEVIFLISRLYCIWCSSRY